MKKIFTLFASALMAVAAMAETVTFTAPGEWTTEQTAQTETKNGITISTTQGVGNVQYRVYKGQTFTVSSTVGNITKMEIVCTANGTAKYGPGNFTDATSGEYSYEAEGVVGVWTGNAAEFSLTASTNQVRMTSIVVTYGDSSSDPDPGTDPEPETPTLQDINTCANLIACYDAKVVAQNDSVCVGAYISGMFLKPTNFAKYGSVCIWLTDTEGGSAKEFELYNCYGYNADTLSTFVPVEGEVDLTISQNTDVKSVTGRNGVSYKLGDYVIAKGKITKYNTTYELNTGCFIVNNPAAESIEAVEAEKKAAKTCKVMQNGEFFIIKNGKTYNAAGFEVR